MAAQSIPIEGVKNIILHSKIPTSPFKGNRDEAAARSRQHYCLAFSASLSSRDSKIAVALQTASLQVYELTSRQDYFCIYV